MSSSNLSVSENMIDYYCAPSIHSDRPKAPKRRMPKDPRVKRRSTIEFMASFLMLKSRDSEIEAPPRKAPGRKRSSDVKPTCPNRRTTMEFLWKQLSSLEFKPSNNDSDGSAGTTGMSSSAYLEEEGDCDEKGSSL
jgi:hypothetical protein